VTARISRWTLDVPDLDGMARFWSAALGYRIAAGDDGSATLYPPRDAGPEGNRNHPDLTAGGDVDAEVQRLIGLGARRVDVGQRDDDPFVVLADPEGNECCVPRRTP
jgi:catechol 2,3-dioxygenase-like lactoylglutathione lyase family enzyme